MTALFCPSLILLIMPVHYTPPWFKHNLKNSQRCDLLKLNKYRTVCNQIKSYQITFKYAIDQFLMYNNINVYQFVLSQAHRVFILLQ